MIWMDKIYFFFCYIHLLFSNHIIWRLTIFLHAEYHQIHCYCLLVFLYWFEFHFISSCDCYVVDIDHNLQSWICILWQVCVFMAPKIIGGLNAPTPVGELGMSQMTQAINLIDHSYEQVSSCSSPDTFQFRDISETNRVTSQFY